MGLRVVRTSLPPTLAWNSRCDTVGTRLQVISRLHDSGGDHQYQTSSWKYSGSQAWVTIIGWDSMQSWVTLKSWHKAESSSTGQWITYTNL